jgi:hypothetical protein
MEKEKEDWWERQVPRLSKELGEPDDLVRKAIKRVVVICNQESSFNFSAGLLGNLLIPSEKMKKLARRGASGKIESEPSKPKPGAKQKKKRMQKVNTSIEKY